MYKNNKHIKKLQNQGFTLIDAVVGTALMLIFVLAVVGIFRVSAQLIFLNKARAGALTLANEQLEFARNLTYTKVGVAGSFINGSLLATETIPFNGIKYTRTTFVEYVDDEKDGLASTTDDIPTDYKKIKTKVSWDYKGETKNVTLSTNIVPNGSEGNVGGGTISVTVLDSLGVPLSNATIIIKSASLGTTETRFTPTSGNYRFYGVATSSDYEVTVKKTGDSTAMTYAVDATNVDPNPGHVAVVDGSTSSVGFSIDVFATLELNTFVPPKELSYEHLFNNSTGLFLSSTEILGGEARLASSSGMYVDTGTLFSDYVTSTNLATWERVEWNDTVVASTSIAYHVYYKDGANRNLIPDSVLSGNSVGFSTTGVDLTDINISTYLSLSVGAELITEDLTVTPSIQDWKIVYTTSLVPVPVPFTLRGTKTIGKNASGNNIYKNSFSGLSTDGNGHYSTTTVEWDEYKMMLNVASVDYDIANVCDKLSPYSVDGEYMGFDVSSGENKIINVFLETHSLVSLLVSVQDSLGNPISDADVRIQNGLYDVTKKTGECGQAFFNESDLPSGVTTIEITHASYVSSSKSVTVGSRTQTNVFLTN